MEKAKKVIIIESERSMQKFISTLCSKMNMSCYLLDPNNIIDNLLKIDYIPDLIIVNMKLEDDTINEIVNIIQFKKWHCNIIGLGYKMNEYIYINAQPIKTFNRPLIISQFAKYLGKLFNHNYLAALVL